jgi:E3 ubiquitin-protein ligase NRDP1
METLSRHRIVLDQDSKTGLSDELLCSTCRDVLWKPVYCGKCGCIFCNKCRPQIGFFNRITTFFGAERPRHGRNNCDTFEEAPVPNHITTNLRKLRVRCAYAQNGCRTLPFYYDLEQHEEQCEFEKIPCELCQKPLSKRRPVEQHSTHACFEEMRRKNPAGIQQ